MGCGGRGGGFRSRVSREPGRLSCRSWVASISIEPTVVLGADALIRRLRTSLRDHRKSHRILIAAARAEQHLRRVLADCAAHYPSRAERYRLCPSQFWAGSVVDQSSAGSSTRTNPQPETADQTPWPSSGSSQESRSGLVATSTPVPAQNRSRGDQGAPAEDLGGPRNPDAGARRARRRRRRAVGSPGHTSRRSNSRRFPSTSGTTCATARPVRVRLRPAR